MKLTDWILIFFFVMGAFAAVFFFRSNTNTEAGITTGQYTDALSAACDDAIKTIDLQKLEQGVWSENEAKQKTLGTFYNTLAFCFNTEFSDEADSTHLYTPVVCLIDTDGYYISYNSVFDEYGNVYLMSSLNEFSSRSGPVTDKVSSYESITTSPINTWTKNYGDFHVKFYLTDNLEITLPDGRVYKNNRDKLKEQFDLFARYNPRGGERAKDSAGNYYEPTVDQDNYETSKLNKLLGDDSFYEEEKNSLIVSDINREVEYYINYRNQMAKNADIPYGYTMPQVSGEDWHRLLENPTVISFLQGTQVTTGKELVNIYSGGGGELVKDQLFFIAEDASGDLRYHYLKATNCSDYIIRSRIEETEVVYKTAQNEEIKSVYKHEIFYYHKYNDTLASERKTKLKAGTWWKAKVPEDEFDGWTEIEDIYSMAECAKKKIYPCDCAINHNSF